MKSTKKAKATKKARVGDCSLEPAISCEKNHSALEAAMMLKKNNSRYIVVVEKGEPIGIISSSDISHKVVAENKNPGKTKAEEIMTSPVFILRWDEPLDSAVTSMIKKGMVLCPVINENFKCIGLAHLSELTT